MDFNSDCHPSWSSTRTRLRRSTLQVSPSAGDPTPSMVLDRNAYVHAAFNGGSHSVITRNIILGRPPLPVDDTEISPRGSISVVEPTAFHDMSFYSMTHDVLQDLKRPTFIPKGGFRSSTCNDQTRVSGKTWHSCGLRATNTAEIHATLRHRAPISTTHQVGR